MEPLRPAIRLSSGWPLSGVSETRLHPLHLLVAERGQEVKVRGGGHFGAEVHIREGVMMVVVVGVVGVVSGVFLSWHRRVAGDYGEVESGEFPHHLHLVRGAPPGRRALGGRGERGGGAEGDGVIAAVSTATVRVFVFLEELWAGAELRV